MRDDELPDVELLARAREHPALLGVIYERHATAVFRFLARRVGSAAAEDLLAEVFLVTVADHLRVQPHASGSALPWLYGIAGNVVRSHLRHRGTRFLVDADGAVDWDAVDARLDASARRSDLRIMLAALSDADREVLLLVAWEGLTPAEAGEALGLTAEAARKRLQRARSRAQSALNEMTPAR